MAKEIALIGIIFFTASHIERVLIRVDFFFYVVFLFNSGADLLVKL
jgi:hypothetical protein